MKNVVYIITLLFVSSVLNAQLVLTVAGNLEQSGSDDGFFFEATFNNPHGIAVDGQGIIYVADRYNHLIRRVTPEGNVTTIAGTGIAGDEDGVGTQASFNEPWGICADAVGNLYVADTRNNKIRKVDTQGNVTTIAGTGNYGTSNGTALSSTFGNPTGIELDPDGNIIIADHLTHIIRKIDGDGIVTTIAGIPYVPGAVDGTANQAMFYRPYGLHVDDNGIIFIADEWNHRIRKIDTTGIVSTVAGMGVIGNDDGPAGQATFNYPWDITTDNSGNLYIADGYNYTIRKITTQGIVSTYAGTVQTQGGLDGLANEATFSGLTSIAFDDLTNTFYLGDAYNHLVRKIIDLQVGVSIFSDAEGSTLCQNQSFTITASPSFYQQFDYLLNGELIHSSFENTYTFSDLDVGSNEIQVIAYNNENEWFSNTLIYNIVTQPDVDVTIVGETEINPGDTTILVASIAQNYLWSNGETGATLEVTEAGDFWVEITDVNGCSATSDIISINWIENVDAPTINNLGNSFLCFGEQTTLESSYPSGNQWYRDGWPINGETNRILTVNQTGVYRVKVVNEEGINIFSNEVDIEVSEQQIFDFSASQTNLTSSNNQVNFSCNCNENLSYQWNFGDENAGVNNTSDLANPTFAFTAEGLYTVTLITTDLQGCSDTLTKVNLISFSTGGNPNPDPDPDPNLTIDENTYFIPTAFTPNDDGLNDFFEVLGDYEKIISMTIFNQWGQCIFNTTLSNAVWNGTINNKKVETGTYVYQISLKLNNGISISKTGHVSVIY